MGKVIIFPTDNGIAVICPCDRELTVEQIAQKDVPEGVKYRIVDEGEIPSERSQRDLWTADFTTYNGIGGQP